MKWTTSWKDTICQNVHKKTQMIWIVIYLLKILDQKWITSSITCCCCCCCCCIASVMSDSVRPHRWQPIRLPHPWDSPGKNTGVGCHFLLQCMKVKVKVKSLTRVWLLATPWTAAYQAPLSMEFSRQEYWSGLPLPSPMTNLDSIFEKQRHHFANKGYLVKALIFSYRSSHVWMWELDHKEGWVPNNWWLWIVVLEKTLESLLDSREIKPILKEIYPEYSLEGLK